MSAQWLITDGYGGSPGSTKYIVTMGLVPDGAEPSVDSYTYTGGRGRWRRHAVSVLIAIYFILRQNV